MARDFYLIKVVTFRRETPVKAKVIYNHGIVAWGQGETVKKAVQAAQSRAYELYQQKFSRASR